MVILLDVTMAFASEAGAYSLGELASKEVDLTTRMIALDRVATSGRGPDAGKEPRHRSDPLPLSQLPSFRTFERRLG